MEFDGQWDEVQNRGVQLECVEKQGAEMFEHFGKEIPEQTDVWLEITVV